MQDNLFLKTKSKSIGYRFDDKEVLDTFRFIKNIAHKHDISFSKMVLKILKKYRKDNEHAKKASN